MANETISDGTVADEKDGIDYFILVMYWLFVVYAIAQALLAAAWLWVRRASSKTLGFKEARVTTASALSSTTDHRARLTIAVDKEMESAENDRFQQRGYKWSLLGACVRWAWFGFVVLTQLAIALLLVIFYATYTHKIFKPYCIIYYPSGALLFSLMQLPSTSYWFLLPCSLEEATHVLIEEENGEAQSDNMSALSSWQKTLNCFKQDLSRTLVLVVRDIASTQRRWFIYTCVTYLWNEADRRFRPIGRTNSIADCRVDEGLGSEIADGLMNDSENMIRVPVPTVVQSLITEFGGSFIYVFQLYCMWLAMAFNSWNMGMVYLFSSIGSGMVNALICVRKPQLAIQDIVAEGQNITVEVLRDCKWETTSSIKLVPRDVIRFTSGIVPADCVLVRGGAVVNESMLTGEPTPVQKYSMESLNEAIRENKHKKYILFAGTEILQADGAVAIVFATGAMTMKGQLVRMILYPSPIRFKFTAELPLVYALLGFYGLMCTLVVTSGAKIPMIWALFSGTFCLLQALNPLLPVSLGAGQAVGVSRLRKAWGVQCLAPPRLTIAGKLGVVVFDKTGTLTHPGLSLVSVQLAAESHMGAIVAIHADPEQATKQLPPLWVLALATCNSVGRGSVGSEYVGNEVEINMFRASGWYLEHADGVRKFRSPSGTVAKALRVLEFDHERMTSGVLLSVTPSLGNGEPYNILLMKGSYEKIASLCNVPNDFADVTSEAAAAAFYVLGVAFRNVSETEVENLMVSPRSSFEDELTLLGLLRFSNELKSDTNDALEELRQGDIHVVMCTGDSVHTGVAIAEKCGILHQECQVLIGDVVSGELIWRDKGNNQVAEGEARFKVAQLAVTGSAFKQLLQTGSLERLLLQIRVFARMTPDQKVSVVTLHQSKGHVTGMCGDGGNDCAALRTAHVGVALSDAEASVVAPFSSTQSKSIFAVVGVAKVGRACLATNMACFKFFLLNGLVITFGKVCLAKFMMNIIPAEWHFIWGDNISPWVYLTAITSCCFEAQKLAPKRPPSSLFGLDVLLSVIVPWVAYVIICSCVFTVLTYQDFFLRYSQPLQDMILAGPPANLFLTGDNVFAATNFMLQLPFVAAMVIAYSVGGTFRRPCYKSITFLILVSFMICVSYVLLFTGPNCFTCMLRINCSNRVSSQCYIPIVKELSVSGVGDCFFDPHADVWLRPSYHEPQFRKENLNVSGAASYFISAKSKPPCRPPDDSGLPLQFDPQNTFRGGWIVLLVLVTSVLGIGAVGFTSFLVDPLAHRIIQQYGTKIAASAGDGGLEIEMTNIC